MTHQNSKCSCVYGAARDGQGPRLTLLCFHLANIKEELDLGNVHGIVLIAARITMVGVLDIPSHED